MSSVLDLSTLEGLADIALNTGAIVIWHGYMVIPDLALIEGIANAYPPLPPTMQGTRNDGRTVRVYTLPGEAA